MEAQADLARLHRIAMLGQLSASIAHEVSQPFLAAVANSQAALNWLNREPPNLEEVRGALCRLVDNVARAGEIIRGLRALSGTAPGSKDELSINEVTLEVIVMTRAHAEENGISVRTKLADNLPIVQGSRVQVQQVILNLITNAVEAMSGVSVGARELRIRTGKAGQGSVFVAVSDSGPGIPPTMLSHVFEPFYTSKSDGLGLGLWICRSIVEAHGGHFRARPIMPQGASFCFTLPHRHAAQ